MSWTSIVKNLLTVCVLTSSAVSTVGSYTCANYACLNRACGPNSQTCNASHGCFSLIQEFKAPATSLSLMAQEKGCSTTKCTQLLVSATLGGQRTFGYEHRCCDHEQCNKNLQLSPPSSQTNGVECPACYNETDMSCVPVSLKCTGAQTKCVEVIGTGKSTNGASSLVLYGMGCATETACGLNMHIFGDIKVRVFCTNSISGSPLTTPMPSTSTNGSPPLSSISPVLTGLLLLKVLL